MASCGECQLIHVDILSTHLPKRSPLKFISSFTLVVPLLAFAASWAQTTVPTRTPTIDQSLEMQSASSPKISPDGSRVIYEQSRTNWEADTFDTDLWLANVETHE